MTGNVALWLAGVAVDGVVFYVVMRSVRRTVRPRPRPPVRAVAVIARPEIPVPPRKALPQ